MVHPLQLRRIRNGLEQGRSTLYYIRIGVYRVTRTSIRHKAARQRLPRPTFATTSRSPGHYTFSPNAQFHRLTQRAELQNLPRYLFNFAVRFATGSYPSTIPSPAHTASTTPARDPFGFRQLIVAATDFGRVYAIDTANGEIVWSRILGLGWAGEPGKKGNVVGGRVDVVKVFAIKPVGSGTIATEQVTKPEVVLVAQRTAHNVRSQSVCVPVG
jgi:hypothetical protein